MSSAIERSLDVEICPCCGRPLGPPVAELPDLHRALKTIVVGFATVKSFPYAKVREASEKFGIPLETFDEAARLLKVDRVIDTKTGEERWELPERRSDRWGLG
jgi:hypothetical protein